MQMQAPTHQNTPLRSCVKLPLCLSGSLSGCGRTLAHKHARKHAGTLFCFDEFNVTDVGDAVILRTLMDAMWDAGAVLVTTSNRHPRDLYKNGIQRELFVPCINRIQERSQGLGFRV